MADTNTDGLDADISELLDAERVPEAAPEGARERVWGQVRETIAAPGGPAAPGAELAGALSSKATFSMLAVVTVAGARLNVIGIPPDNPSNAAGGPFKLMAALRDANVPYTFPYSDLSKYRNNGPSLPSLPSGLPSLPTPSLPSLSLPSLPF